jgi:hypothetical protein
VICRAVRAIRAGTQNRIRHSAFAWRRKGVSLGAWPDAAAAGERSQRIAVMFNAITLAVI